jgi:hypothetical protein
MGDNLKDFLYAPKWLLPRCGGCTVLYRTWWFWCEYFFLLLPLSWFISPCKPNHSLTMAITPRLTPLILFSLISLNFQTKIVSLPLSLWGGYCNCSSYGFSGKMHVFSQMLLVWINAMLQYQIKSHAVKELNGNVPITSSTLMCDTSQTYL